MQSIGSTKTYAYRTSGDLISEKEEIKYSNIKRYKKWLILIIIQKKL